MYIYIYIIAYVYTSVYMHIYPETVLQVKCTILLPSTAHRIEQVNAFFFPTHKDVYQCTQYLAYKTCLGHMGWLRSVGLLKIIGLFCKRAL